MKRFRALLKPNKRFIAGFLAGLMLPLSITAVGAVSKIQEVKYNDVTVSLNGKDMPLSQPLISVIDAETPEYFSNYMPVREILEKLGYTVDWKGNNIDLTASSSQTLPSQSSAAQLMSASAKQQIDAGEEFIVTAMTNQYATIVNLLDANGAVLSTSGQFVAMGDYRSFTLRYTPPAQNAASYQFKVVAGDVSGFDAASAKTVSVSVNVDIYVLSVDYAPEKPKVNDSVNITVTTNSYAGKVKITNQKNQRVYEAAAGAINGQTQSRAFTINNVAIDSEGSHAFVIDIATSNGAYRRDPRTFTISTEAAAAPAEALAIRYADHNKTQTYRIGDYVSVKVVTSNSALSLSVTDRQTNAVEKYTYYTDGAEGRVFDVRVRLSANDNLFTFSAYDKSGVKVDATYSIKVGAISDVIKNVTHYEAAAGSNVYYLQVYTTTNTYSVTVKNAAGSPAFALNPTTLDSTTLVWAFTGLSRGVFTITTTDTTGKQETTTYTIQ